MLEEQLITVRWAVYLDLGLLFGLPFFRLYGGIGDAAVAAYRSRLPLVGLALVGLLLSAWQFTAMVAGMTGATELLFDGQTLIMVLKETSVGLAFAARTAALTLVAGLTLNSRLGARWSPVLTCLCAGTALATLAWNGHGAATEGPIGNIHLASDIIHLLAASAWLGALVSFLWMTTGSSMKKPGAIKTAHSALAAFATSGSIMVGVIVMTGLINSAAIIGLDRLGSLTTSAYGGLLIIKLALFLIMLLLASLNRFRLTPRLEVGIAERERGAELAALRCSLWLETSLGIMILAVVAWLGTLPPPGTG